MKFTDIFIKKPVLATVVSLLILLLGLNSLQKLPLREFPEIKNTVINVSTVYAGADAELIQGFITSPVEKAITGADGVDYITANSKQSVSTVSAHIRLNYDPDKAFTNIMSKVAQVRNQLPSESEAPIIQKNTGAQVALMYVAFDSVSMSPEQITEYIARVVQPKLATISGVAEVQLLGANTFAMRVWLDPVKMAAYKITPGDVAMALKEKNFLSAAGKTKGEYVSYNVKAATDLQTPEEFKNIIIRHDHSAMIRLKDVAKVSLGSENYDSLVTFNGKKAIFIGIMATPSANPLTVISNINKEIPKISKSFPNGLKATVVYDATKYIKASIREVIQTIIEATLIVILVIYLFLGSIRSVSIPVITIPLSLIGVCSLLLFLGYSINLLTLLAMVLAIGLVVDDAIVVVENIYRHIEEGLTPYEAALTGAREIALPVVAMTITLAAVYAPIGFMGGLTGQLFTEFAFTLAATVIISGVIALTLSPMMCSKILDKNIGSNRMVQYVDNKFNSVKEKYSRSLQNTLNNRRSMLIVAIIVLSGCFYLYSNTQQQLAPNEDQSALFISATAPQSANLDYVTSFTEKFNQIFKSIPETQDYFVINGMGEVNNVIAGLMLKPWGERTRSQAQLQQIVQKKLQKISGLNAAIFPLPSLPVGDGGMPISFVLTSTGNFNSLYKYSEQLLGAARKSGLFMFIDNSLKFNKPQVSISIDRDKAAKLGVNIQSIGNALSTAIGGNYVNRFNMQGKSYQVIPQVEQQFRLLPEQLQNIYVRGANDELIPLKSVTYLNNEVRPNSLAQFNQLNAATLQGMAMPGHTMAEALDFLSSTAERILPKNISYDYSGQSRQFMQEGNRLIYTFFLAIILIYLVLAAQFESFTDPLVILISVPMSICGALIPLNLGAASINIYTQVGLITLIGLISKHGILMVDFANHLRKERGLSIQEAIQTSASIRLRPILMTTGAMVLGVTPLIFAQGAGAASRYCLGLVIASGLTIGTLFTLFVVPTMYTYLAKATPDTSSESINTSKPVLEAN